MICQLYKNKNYQNFNLPKNIVTEQKLDKIAIDSVEELIKAKRGKDLYLLC